MPSLQGHALPRSDGPKGRPPFPSKGRREGILPSLACVSAPTSPRSRQEARLAARGKAECLPSKDTRSLEATDRREDRPSPRRSEGRHSAFPGVRQRAYFTSQPAGGAPGGAQGRQNAFPPRTRSPSKRRTEGKTALPREGRREGILPSLACVSAPTSPRSRQEARLAARREGRMPSLQHPSNALPSLQASRPPSLAVGRV